MDDLTRVQAKKAKKRTQSAGSWLHKRKTSSRRVLLTWMLVLLIAAFAIGGCSMQLLSSGQSLTATAFAAEESTLGESNLGEFNADSQQAQIATSTPTADASDDESAEDESAETDTPEPSTLDPGEFPQQLDADRLEELLAVQSARLTYNGEIVAVQRVEVMPEVSGMAVEVNVEVGDEVENGDILVRVNSASLEAARERALAGLEATQADLDLMLAEPEEEELEAARAAVNAAASAYQRVLDGPRPEDIRIAQAALAQAEAGVTVARAAYNQVRGNPQIAALPQSLELQRATLELEAAQAEYDKITNGPTDDEIADAYAALAQARANLASVQRGPRAAEIRAMEAQVSQAETDMYLAQLELEKAAIRAPFDGVVADVGATVGTMLGSSTPAVTLLSHDVKVLIPVEEFRLTSLAEDQPAAIRVDAYPDRLFEGVVMAIAPELDPATRTVEVTIRPTSSDATDLAPGMFATVDLVDLSDEADLTDEPGADAASDESAESEDAAATAEPDVSAAADETAEPTATPTPDDSTESDTQAEPEETAETE